MALLAQRLDFIKNFPQLTVFQNLLFNLNVVKETKSKNIALGFFDIPNETGESAPYDEC
jgi:hypothetical protein